MAIKLKCKFNIADGESFGHLVDKLRSMPFGEYKVFVCDSKPQRSLKQNAYYWAVVIPLMAEHLGYTKNEMHELFKRQFLPQHKVTTANGKTFTWSTSTRTLPTNKFEEYLEEINALAVTMDVYIPEPGEIPDEFIINTQ
jgi:hypothetical protein